MTNLHTITKPMFFMVLFCLTFFGTVTQVNAQSDVVPPWLNSEYANAPDDMILGIGTAKLVNSRDAMKLAEIRARSDIVAQLYTWREVSRRGDDEFDNLYSLFRTCIYIEASFEIINDTRVSKTWVAPDGTNWCLVTMRKSDSRKYNKSIFENIYKGYYDMVFKK